MEDRKQRIFISRVQGPNQPKNYSFPLVLLEQKEKRDVSGESGLISGYGWTTRNPQIQFYVSIAPRPTRKKLIPPGLSSKREKSFITKGFINWKDACSSFKTSFKTDTIVSALMLGHKYRPINSSCTSRSGST